MSFYSTTSISKLYGLTAKPLVFDFLHKNNFTFQHNEKPYQRLTQKGLEYGQMFHDSNKGEEWIIWNESLLAPILKELKWNIMLNHDRKFSLYHMTHMNNLPSIIQHQRLLSHNQIQDYEDISNVSVNTRRRKTEPCFNHAIHDYVPLYLNPRNAMLYTVQNTYDDIIILKINTSVCLNPYTIFSYMNAAADDAQFYYDIKEFLDSVDWARINSWTWFDDPYTKKAMMSECLIYNSIPISYIERIECNSQLTAAMVSSTLYEYPGLEHLPVYYKSRLFFDL